MNVLYKTKVAILFFCLFIFSALTPAAEYIFDSPTQQKQFEHLIEELRCLVCQNESLWDSRAPLAKDLRDEVYKKIKQGESSEAIEDYLVERYGQFILFKPRLNPETYLLWLIPFGLLVCAFIIVGMTVHHSRRKKK